MNLLRIFLFVIAVALGIPASANITSTANRTGPYTCTSLPAVLSAVFPFQASSELLVLDIGQGGTSNDPPVVLTLNSDYTVSGGGYNATTNMQSGNVTVVTAGAHNVQVGDQVIILRSIPVNQQTSFVSGILTAAVIEKAFDKQATLSQQLTETAGRSLRFEPGETLNGTLLRSARMGKYLGFDSAGNIAYLDGGSGGGSGGTYTAGAGLQLASNQFSILPSQSLTSLTVVNPIAGSVTGNAATATALQNSRLINGVGFNGTGDIVVPADASTLQGTTLASNVVNSSLTNYAGGAFGTMAMQASSAVNITGGAINGASVTGLAAPTLSADAANKAYVDSISAGITPRTGVVAATTANITLSAPQTIDGQSVIAGNRVLVKNQTLPAQNGIYDVAAGAWTRSSDSDTAGELLFGYYYFVSSGSTQASTSWFIQTAPATINVSPVLFSQFSASSTYLAGTGIQLTGNTFSINPVQSALTINGSDFNGTLGATTPSTASVTTLTATGTTSLVGNVAVGAPAGTNKFEVVGDGNRNTARASTTAGNSIVEAQASDFWTAPSFRGTSLSQYGSTAAGTTNGISNASLGLLSFQNVSNAMLYTNTLNPIYVFLQANEAARFTATGIQAPIGQTTPKAGTFTNIAGNGSAVTSVSTGSVTARSLAARDAEVINALDYGADNTGATDNSAAFTAVYNAALANDGTVPELLLNRYIGGFTTPPSNSWTGRPALTLTGGLGSGFSAFGNINPQGFLCSIEIANRGTGYNILTYTCNRVNGSPTITLSSGTFDARIVAGTSVRFESLQMTCTVLTRNSNISLTLTENMTFTNADQFVFGFPIVNIAGTPAPDDIAPVVGSPRIVKFPAGAYKLTGGFPSMGGLSNVTFEATGASFQFTSVTGAGFGIRNSTAVTWNGGDFYYQGSRFSVPTTRSRYPGQEGFAIGSSQWMTVRNVTTWSAFEFGFVISGEGTVGSYWCSRIRLEGCRANSPLGDGIHVTTGTRFARILNCDVSQPGDDAFAIVNDYDVAAKAPIDIEYNTCRVDGGLYRGCVTLGSLYTRFINITGRDTHGPFLWALADGIYDAPQYVTFENVVAENIGNTNVTASDSNSGIGIRADTVTGLRIRNCSFKQDGSVLGLNSAWMVVDSTITDGDWPGRKIQAISSTGTLAGVLNTDLVCPSGSGFASITLTGPHRYLVTGTVSARSSTAASGQFWPVFWDGSTEYGSGSSFQFSSNGERTQLKADAVIEVQSGSKSIIFKVKQGGGGVTLDAGSTTGPNSVITATQID